MSMKHGIIPADVPQDKQSVFEQNYNNITKQTGRLFLFAADHKIEHLNDDFHGPSIHSDALDPQHLFEIAQKGTVGAMATHPSFIARYGKNYNDIHYIAKLNGKTHVMPSNKQDPLSAPLWNVHDVITLAQESNLSIAGIGVTIYLGSEYEQEMLSFAAQSIFEAHQHGLVAILWAYARGSAIKKEQDPHVLAGAAGLANALGADFVKIKQPKPRRDVDKNAVLNVITHAAGNTKVVCAGGQLVDKKTLLHNVFEQINTGKTAGCAVGRNIFQHARPQAIALSQAIAAIVYDNEQVNDALKLYDSLTLLSL